MFLAPPPPPPLHPSPPPPPPLLVTCEFKPFLPFLPPQCNRAGVEALLSCFNPSPLRTCLPYFGMRLMYRDTELIAPSSALAQLSSWPRSHQEIRPRLSIPPIPPLSPPASPHTPASLLSAVLRTAQKTSTSERTARPPRQACKAIRNLQLLEGRNFASVTLAPMDSST